MAERLYDHLITLGLGKENLTNFSKWFEAQSFRQQVENFENQLRQARNEEERKEIRRRYANFQRGAIRTIIAQMRTYPGWVERPFQPLRDSSPSQISQEESLNCAGRTLLLGRVLTLLGFSPEEILYASSIGHSSLFVFFKEGQGARVGPSSFKGREIFLVSPQLVEKIKGEIKKRGMTLGININGEYYSFFPFDRGITAAILGNFNIYLPHSKEKLQLRNLEAHLMPSGNTLENWFFVFYKASGNPISFEGLPSEKQALVLEMAEKIYQAQPDIEKVVSQDEAKFKETGWPYNKEFYPFLRSCLEAYQEKTAHHFSSTSQGE